MATITVRNKRYAIPIRPLEAIMLATSITSLVAGFTLALWAITDMMGYMRITGWMILGQVFGVLLAICAVVFLLSGLDDLFLDIVYYTRRILANKKMKRAPYAAISLEQLNTKARSRVALMVPCWQESEVIGAAVAHNLEIIDYDNYEVFVGTYPNDQATINAVAEAAARFPRVHCVVGTNPGPTNKADNLNQIYTAIIQYQKETGQEFDIIVMHDAEDVIHPMAFKLYNYLMPEAGMVQIPIFPLEVPLFNFTHWVYNDEFAEYHVKDVVSRGLISGIVPSAGVGTAFSKEALHKLDDIYAGEVFSTNSLTEDYAISVKIRKHNLKPVFVQQFVPRIIERRRFFGIIGPYVETTIPEWIATRSFFPTVYRNAVRQRSRWCLGIVFQEWTNTGWPGTLAMKYCLYRDRKALFANFMTMIGYMVFIYTVIFAVWANYWPDSLQMLSLMDARTWLSYVLAVDLFLMLFRMSQKMLTNYRLYGFLPAMLSVTRTPYANVMSSHAMLIALRQFIKGRRTGIQIKWEKTTNRFPTLVTAERKVSTLQDILKARGYVTDELLAAAVAATNGTDEAVVEYLLKNAHITEQEHMQSISELYQVPFVDIEAASATPGQLKELSSSVTDTLLRHGIIPVRLIGDHLLLVLAQPDLAFGDPEILDVLSDFTIELGLALPDDIERYYQEHNISIDVHSHDDDNERPETHQAATDADEPSDSSTPSSDDSADSNPPQDTP